MSSAISVKLREGGGVITANIAMAAAKGILIGCDKPRLSEYGSHIDLSYSWWYPLVRRMKFVKRKATTAKSKFSGQQFSTLKRAFLRDVALTVEMEDIEPELIVNWDQTGLKIVPVSSWTINEKGAKRVEIVGLTDKRQITAVFCGSLTGEFLPPQLIYTGKTRRCHPRFKFPNDWSITHSANHWSTEKNHDRPTSMTLFCPLCRKQTTIASSTWGLCFSDHGQL